MNDIDTPHHDLATRLGAMASRVAVENRLEEAKGELRYATVMPISRQGRIPMLAGIATLAAASVATVAVIQRPNASEEQSRPPAFGASPVATQAPASATPGLLFDRLPIIDEADIPLSGLALYVSFGERTEDQEWVRQTFVAGINDASPRFTNTPTDVISITAFLNREASTIFPEAKPGRRSDVAEMSWGDGGGTTLIWSLDGRVFTMVGSNLELMYELLDRTSPVVPADDLAFFVDEPLPGGLVALNAQIRGGPGLFPTVSDEAGRFSMEMADEAALQLIAGQSIERLQVGDYVAWLAKPSEGRRSNLAIELTSRQTVVISGDGLDREQLIAIGEKIRFVDEATWRVHYNFPEVPTLSAPTTALATEATEYVPDATEYVTPDTTYTATITP